MKNPGQPMKKTLSAIAVVVFAFAVVMAQRSNTPPTTEQSIKGAEIKGLAPVNKEVLKVKLPPVQEMTMPNGLRIILVESHRVPTFTMQMVILSGGLSDPPDYRGLSTFTAALLREGTATRKSKEIAEQIEAIGATLSAGSSVASFTTGINTSGLVENFDQVLDIFADVICHPNFPQDEIDKYRTRQIQQNQLQRAIPQFLSNERFQTALYGSHPAGLSVPPVASFNRALSADLAGFHATYYRPNNAMLVIFSDLTLDQLTPKLMKAFGSWQRKGIPKTIIPAAPAPEAASIDLINRPGSVQTVLVMGNLTLERKDPDYIPLLVMNQVLGGGPASRLFMNLREGKGYTYGASSGVLGLKYKGMFLAQSDVRTEVTDGAMHEFMYEFNRIRDEKVTATELENAKRALVGSFAISLTEPQILLGMITQQRLYHLPANYWDNYPQKVMAITAGDVQRTAQKYVDLKHMKIVAVGDAAKTRGVLAKYGTVHELDFDGIPVAAGKPK